MGGGSGGGTRPLGAGLAEGSPTQQEGREGECRLEREREGFGSLSLSSFSLSHEDDSVPSFLLILVIGGADLSSSSARRPRLSARGMTNDERENEERGRE